MIKNFDQEAFDIIILAGQSNAEGYGFGEIDQPYKPDPRVWYLNNDPCGKGEFILTPAEEKVSGNEIQSSLALSFATEYLKSGRLAENRRLLIIRAALGGTGFVAGHWRTDGSLFLGMMKMIEDALAMNPQNRLVAMLWHQGENDAGKTTYDDHYNDLMTLLQMVRREFNVPKLPFVAGDFVHDWKDLNIDRARPVADAVCSVCCDAGYGRFVKTGGLLSNRQELGRNPLGWIDRIHFSRRAVYDLGVRYFNAFIEIENESTLIVD